AGGLAFEAALRVVRLRGELMEGAYPKGYGMAAIIGVGEIKGAAIGHKIYSSASPLFLASVNAPREIVLAGADGALRTAGEQARIAGATRVTRLQVGVPSHCALLEREAECLVRAMATLNLSPPEALYVDNRGGRELFSARSICEDLATNMAHPVRWHDGIGVMYERGVRLFVELPPGGVLTALAAAAFPDVRTVACADTRIDSVCALVRRERGGG